tara:strand:- start:990 stop:1970 length:981 start_codon:yes stop_codon:yes gene_type:complete
MSNDEEVVKPPPKKRGRKPKIKNPEDENSADKNVTKVPKKRGRKPKGGKIITNSLEKNTVSNHEINIIMHLKCNSGDIKQKSTFFSNVKPHQDSNTKLSFFPISSSKTPEPENNETISGSNITTPNTSPDISPTTSNGGDNKGEIHKKIRELAISLHSNNISNKKSACFWCSYDFENPPIYIPKYKLNDSYHCYGCFCSPECATSYLFKEPINTSLMFKRYNLLNFIYGKIYNHTKSFKPAPDPYYTLEKYYGTLTIEEYRKLNDNKQLLFIVDKPLTRVLPELHEDNEDFILNTHSIPSSSKYTLRKKPKKTQSQIMSENFNLTN